MLETKINTISIVLPCFNEVEGIAAFMGVLLSELDELQKNSGVDGIEVLVVDDGSTDGSFLALEQLDYPALKLIRHPFRLGYGAALKTGFQAARGEFIAFLDLDGTYDPQALADLLHRLRGENLAMVSGDRLHDIQRMPFSRRLGNFLFRALIFSCFRRQVLDSCSGQRIFRREYIPTFCAQLPNQLNFALAMTLLSLRLDLPCAEVPVRYYRRIGRSKLSIVRDGFLFLFTITRFRLLTSRQFKKYAFPGIAWAQSEKTLS